MSSVEGLWKFQSTSVEDGETMMWGGVVVLESGKVLGGDSAMAYVGNYHLDRDIMTARVRSWLWNKEVAEATNVFSMVGDIDYLVDMTGQRNGEVIEGHISPVEDPETKLAFRMEKIADVP